MWKAMSDDIAESHKLSTELSPLELTSLALNRPIPTQEEVVTKKDRRTGMVPQMAAIVYLLPIFILCLLIGVIFILNSLFQRITQWVEGNSMGFGAVLLYFCTFFLLEWRDLMRELMS
jgi:hypothetical protein